MNTVILRYLVENSPEHLRVVLLLWLRASEIPPHLPPSLRMAAKMDTEMVLDLCLLSGLSRPQTKLLVEEGDISAALSHHANQLYQVANNKFQLGDNLRTILSCPIKSYVTLISIEVAAEHVDGITGEVEEKMLRAKDQIIDHWRRVNPPSRELWSQETKEKNDEK